MSKLVKKNVSFFRLMSTSSSRKQRRALLDTITADQLKSLIEIIVNLLEGVLQITSKRKSELGRYKTLIRTLGDKSVSLHRKQKLLRGRDLVIVILIKSVESALNNFLA